MQQFNQRCFDLRNVCLVYQAKENGSLTNPDLIRFSLLHEKLVELFIGSKTLRSIADKQLEGIQAILNPPPYMKKIGGKMRLSVRPMINGFTSTSSGSPAFKIGHEFYSLMVKISFRVSPICDCPKFVGPPRFADMVRHFCDCSVLKPESKFELRHFRETQKEIFPLEKFDHFGTWEPDALDEQIHLVLKNHSRRSSLTLQQLTKLVFLSQADAPDESTLNRNLRLLREFEKENPWIKDEWPKLSLFRGVDVLVYYN